MRTFGSNFALATMESIADWGSLADSSNGQAAADYLAELPPTSYVAAWLHFPEDLSTQELFALEERYALEGGLYLPVGGRAQRRGAAARPGGLHHVRRALQQHRPQLGGLPHVQLVPDAGGGEVLQRGAYAQHFLSMLSFIAGRPQAENALAWGQNFSAVLTTWRSTASR